MDEYLRSLEYMTGEEELIPKKKYKEDVNSQIDNAREQEEMNKGE